MQIWFSLKELILRTLGEGDRKRRMPRHITPDFMGLRPAFLQIS